MKACQYFTFETVLIRKFIIKVREERLARWLDEGSLQGFFFKIGPWYGIETANHLLVIIVVVDVLDLLVEIIQGRDVVRTDQEYANHCNYRNCKFFT